MSTETSRYLWFLAGFLAGVFTGILIYRVALLPGL